MMENFGLVWIKTSKVFFFNLESLVPYCRKELKGAAETISYLQRPYNNNIPLSKYTQLDLITGYC